jgi:hypothetical protein
MTDTSWRPPHRRTAAVARHQSAFLKLLGQLDADD